MPHKKPIGEIGPLAVRDSAFNWEKVRFPDDKVAQEAKVTSLFAAAIERSERTKFEIRTLREADHDARLVNGDHEIDLQLMEIVIPSKKKSPYRRDTRRYDSGYFFDQVVAAIERKIYAENERPLWLLLYPTHWAFVPAPSVEYLLHHYFTERGLAYERVFVLHILDEDHGELTTIYPNIAGQHLDAINVYPDVIAARAQDFILSDPADATFIDGAIRIPI